MAIGLPEPALDTMSTRKRPCDQRTRLTGRFTMGIFSWLRPRKSPRQPKQPKQPHSLIRARYDDPKLEGVQREAAADVAEMERDAKRRSGDA
jgi:hypothetical protein